jgi:hypothetical protein
VIGADKGKEYAAYVDASATVNAPETAVAPPPIDVVPKPPIGIVPPAPEEQAVVDFNSNPPGADILIDGVLVGNTPLVLHVDAGRRLIQLRMGGYSSWTRTMVVEPGSYPSIRATLEKQ